MTEGAIDIATALDTKLEHATIEAKYQKLRLFSAQKIKSLLGTVDNQTKKLKEYRGAPSDGRTATIKALKAKLRDQEFIADVLKEDVMTLKNKAAEVAGERPRCNIKAINQEIIDETIGGPKRFRQLTREEIENNLAELEILEKQYREQPQEKKLTSRQLAAEKKSSQQQREHQRSNQEGSPLRAPMSPDQRMHDLQQKQRDEDLAAQQSRIDQLVEEMDRIRSLSANQKVKKENSALISKDYEELTISMNRMDVTMKDVLDRLKEAKRELATSKEQQHAAADPMVASIERAKKELKDALKENSALLGKLKKIEEELDRKLHGQLMGEDAEDARAATRESDAELDELEKRLRQQLQEHKERRRTLQERVDTIGSLRETLRAKNEEYRVLKRDMAEVAKTKLSPDKISRDK